MKYDVNLHNWTFIYLSKINDTTYFMFNPTVICLTDFHLFSLVIFKIYFINEKRGYIFGIVSNRQSHNIRYNLLFLSDLFTKYDVIICSIVYSDITLSQLA